PPVAGPTDTITLDNRPAGDSFIFVEAAGNAAGNLQVNVTLGGPTLPPSNDDCTTPKALTFTNAVATATGDTTLANNSNMAADPSPTCSMVAKQTGHDVVYSYTLSAATNVQIKVTPNAGSGLRPVVYVRAPSQCAST